MAGWTDYPYPESIWAASQAGVAVQPPVLERLDAAGKWQTLLADPGFPAGLPRMMTVDVTGKLGGPRTIMRLRTNMNVYWDQIFVAPLLEKAPCTVLETRDKSAGLVRATCLEVVAATLEAPGCAGVLPRRPSTHTLRSRSSGNLGSNAANGPPDPVGNGDRAASRPR